MKRSNDKYFSLCCESGNLCGSSLSLGFSVKEWEWTLLDRHELGIYFNVHIVCLQVLTSI